MISWIYTSNITLLTLWGQFVIQATNKLTNLLLWAVQSPMENILGQSVSDIDTSVILLYVVSHLISCNILLSPLGDCTTKYVFIIFPRRLLYKMCVYYLPLETAIQNVCLLSPLGNGYTKYVFTISPRRLLYKQCVYYHLYLSMIK